MGIFGSQGPNPSCAIIKNNQLIAFAEEERFLRIKNADSKLPIKSIIYCLKKSKISIDQIKKIGFAWKCDSYKKKVLKKNLSLGNSISDYYNKAHNTKLSLGFDDILIKENLRFQLARENIYIKKKKIIFIEHHKCHAASAFYCSGFKNAGTVIIDGSGEETTTSFWICKNKIMKKVKEYKLPHTLGGFYSTFTEFLGFKSNSEEGKLMGLAPYGKFSKIIQRKISKIILVKKNGDFYINSTYRFSGKRSFNQLFTDKFIKLFGKPRLKNQKITQYYKNIAFNVQKKLEDVSINLVEKFLKKNKINNLCLAGGVMMNCKLNGKLAKIKNINNIFIQPASSDNGTSLGAAIICALNDGYQNFPKLEHTYYGPSYSNKQILSCIKEAKLKYIYLKDPSKFLSYEIKKGKIIGWFNGPAEFGARSLGARSILANPMLPRMKQKINLEVKHRENWRPFCPSIIEEDFNKYFDTKFDSSFMILAQQIYKKFYKTFPAVIHVDGSVRPQVVKKKYNKNYYKLLKEFKKITGHGVLLNTSFNIQGEPIVNTPYDAIRCFNGTGIDILALGNYILKK